jgi:hypothetical protein
MDMCIFMQNMIIKSWRESCAVSEYLNTGHHWYVATDTFRGTNDNNIYINSIDNDDDNRLFDIGNNKQQ